METKKLTCFDLMIGDYVYSSFSDKPCKVQAIELSEHEYCSVRVSGVEGVKDIVSLSPIPLTAEMLEKNGFELYNQDFTSCRVYKFGCFDYIECNDYHNDSRYNYFSIGCYKEYKQYGTLQKYIHSVMKIRYAHELQHALRLCGINDKEIVL